MPKAKVRVKGAVRNTLARVIRSKFRIGGRKSGKSANLMSTADLVEAYGKDQNTKFKGNIMTVLRNRGADIASLFTVNEDENEAVA